MSLKRARSLSSEPDLQVSRSLPIEDRSSKFVAFYSPTLSSAELRAQPDIQNATHRIAAWRKPSTQMSLSSEPLLESGHNDDGEKYGGKTIEKVMEAMDVQGAVVVARWYGGVLLGPVRFDHIRNCAREAISKWRIANDETNTRKKLQTESEQKAELQQILRERDESIVILRGLLAEKKQQTPSQQNTGSSPTKILDYSKQPLRVLKRLEEVRDATIGWILKSIEEAEKVNVNNPNSADGAVVEAVQSSGV